MRNVPCCCGHGYTYNYEAISSIAYEVERHENVRFAARASRTCDYL